LRQFRARVGMRVEDSASQVPTAHRSLCHQATSWTAAFAGVTMVGYELPRTSLSYSFPESGRYPFTEGKSWNGKPSQS
jgi:hypothetical protein